MRILKWILKLWGRYGPKRSLIIVEDDTPPEILTSRNIYLAREDGENWAVAMRCPCGCGDRLELMLIEEAKPRWSLKSQLEEAPTLHPSVWRNSACQSHYWVRDGRIIWC